MKRLQSFLTICSWLILFVGVALAADRVYRDYDLDVDETVAVTVTFIDQQNVAFRATEVSIWNQDDTVICYVDDSGTAAYSDDSNTTADAIPANAIWHHEYNDPGVLSVSVICSDATTLLLSASDSRRGQ